MRKKALLCSSLILFLSGGTIYAETEQSVFINGNAIDKFVTVLTFNGDNVTLQFEDNSSQIEDMSNVSISLDYNGTSTIKADHISKSDMQSKVYNLNGQYIGNSTNGLSKGVYIVNGKKTVIK